MKESGTLKVGEVATLVATRSGNLSRPRVSLHNPTLPRYEYAGSTHGLNKMELKIRGSGTEAFIISVGSARPLSGWVAMAAMAVHT